MAVPGAMFGSGASTTGTAEEEHRTVRRATPVSNASLQATAATAVGPAIWSAIVVYRGARRARIARRIQERPTATRRVAFASSARVTATAPATRPTADCPRVVAWDVSPTCTA